MYCSVLDYIAERLVIFLTKRFPYVQLFRNRLIQYVAGYSLFTRLATGFVETKANEKHGDLFSKYGKKLPLSIKLVPFVCSLCCPACCLGFIYKVPLPRM